MKLKNTLGLAIGSLIAATSFGALAQGQGAVEGELNYKKKYNDSVNTSKTASTRRFDRLLPDRRRLDERGLRRR
jgi:OOP family OmpA-OmpF porin